MNKFKCDCALRHLRRTAALLIVFVLLFSAVFVVAYANHNCNGADCRICEQVQICLRNMNITVAASQVCAAAALWFALIVLIINGSAAQNAETPITLKVKMLN